MKLRYLVIIKLLAVNIVTSQIPHANFHSAEHEYYDFTGNVKHCEVRNLDQYGKYHSSVLNNKNQDLYYDINQKLTKRITFDINGIYSDSIYSKTYWDYKYIDGKLDSVKKYNIENDSLESYWTYKPLSDSTYFRTHYSSLNDTIEFNKVLLKNNEIHLFKLEDQNNLYLYSITKVEEELGTETTSSYDKKGNIFRLDINKNGIDSTGAKIGILYQINIKRASLSRTVFYFNEHGDEVEVKKYNDKDELLAESYTEYEYDESGNWTKASNRWRTPRRSRYLKHISTRKIEYYE